MDWKTQYGKYVSSPQIDNQISCHSYKTLSKFFVGIDKVFLSFLWKGKGTYVTKTLLQKKNKGCISLPKFKTLCRATVIKTTYY